jgi:hypothetical protein
VVAVQVVIAVTLIRSPTVGTPRAGCGPGDTQASGYEGNQGYSQKYEYDSAVITVKHRDRVRLVVTAVDHDHGLKIDAFHIDQLVKKDESTAIEFNAPNRNISISMLAFLRAGQKRMKSELNGESRALSEVGAFSRSPWLEVRILTVTGSFNFVPGMCIESIRGCLWFVGIPHVFCRFLSAFKI